jgi:protein ImuB
MEKRFVTIWFPHLKTDWISIRRPALARQPFVLTVSDHGKIIISEANIAAQKSGIEKGMALADGKALIPSLKYLDDKKNPSGKLLISIATYCIRFSPVVAVDHPDGLILDATGCAHLWGGEISYLQMIINRFKKMGYEIKAAMADTIGAAWAVCHFEESKMIIQNNDQKNAILQLPVAALRINEEKVELLNKLGLRQINDIITMPRKALRRRLGEQLIERIDQALGVKEEFIQPVQIPPDYEERLPCLEPIITLTGIEIALTRLLETICNRLKKEDKGLRSAMFTCYRVDDKIEKIEIGTNRASNSVDHLFKLFELKLQTIEPALGIELFTIEAFKVEELPAIQEKFWEDNIGINDIKFSELMDRIAGKIGEANIHRYLPDEHYWPERSIRLASSINEKNTLPWKTEKPRPIELLNTPEHIEVTAPVPDYPPMIFRYKNKIHKIKKADGPERIEQEWWIQEGEHRDYYSVEDEDGCRYWIFRLGHYTGDKRNQWFLHGFFA